MYVCLGILRSWVFSCGFIVRILLFFESISMCHLGLIDNHWMVKYL